MKIRKTETGANQQVSKVSIAAVQKQAARVGQVRSNTPAFRTERDITQWQSSRAIKSGTQAISTLGKAFGAAKEGRIQQSPPTTSGEQAEQIKADTGEITNVFVRNSAKIRFSRNIGKQTGKGLPSAHTAIGKLGTFYAA